MFCVEGCDDIAEHLHMLNNGQITGCVGLMCILYENVRSIVHIVYIGLLSAHCMYWPSQDLMFAPLSRGNHQPLAKQLLKPGAISFSDFHYFFFSRYDLLKTLAELVDPFMVCTL